MLKNTSKSMMLIVIVSVVSIITAYFFQYQLNLTPCPLCIMQRIVIVAAGVVALAALLHNPKLLGIKVYASLTFVFSLSGIWFAGRQLYLQSLPADQVPSCMPSLSYLSQVLPTSDLIVILFSGTGDCAKEQWVLFGFSMPFYTLLIFLCLSFFSCIAFFNLDKKLK